MASSHPQEVHERAKRLCAQYGIGVAAEIIGIHRCTLWQMKRRGWKRGSPGRQRPMPTDFAIQCPHMSHQELRDHYGAASGTVTRWRRELAMRS